ncbi:MAG: hypothetical protein ACR2N3_08415 [Pyrinomonadaceae bacterium]
MRQPETKHFYEFGAFRFDTTEKILLLDGETVPSRQRFSTRSKCSLKTPDA